MKNHTQCRLTFRLCSPFMYLLFALTALLVFDCTRTGADTTGGIEYFRNGKHALDAKRYAAAVDSLSVALRDFPLLEDYTLFFLAEAHHQLGDHEASLDFLVVLLKKYPLFPLRQRARASEIRESQEVEADNIQNLFRLYARDYPGDERMSFLYGQFLKQAGADTQAEAVFKQLYLRGSSFSDVARSHLSESDITVPDIMKRARNLMQAYEFRKAEEDLRKALVMDDGEYHDRILKDLGFSLFRQKKYHEAAYVYEKIQKTFSMTRALYRAGDQDGFERALSTLVHDNHRKAGMLLLADAADKRRQREYEKALTIYDTVLKQFPSETEKALWGVGWTYYILGNYIKAADIFSQLYEIYRNPKYLYWHARSSESSGRDAAALFNSLIQEDNNVYGFLSYEKNGQRIKKSITTRNAPLEHSFAELKKYKRIEALQSIDMKKEAAQELRFLSKRQLPTAELIFIIHTLQEIGEYKNAIGLASRIPYTEAYHHFWYPLAFWDTVTEIAEKYELDPLIALSVMREESRFDADAKSIAGARGLMQIMPQTAYALNRRLKLGIHSTSQIHGVRNNIHMGIYYLTSLFKEFNSLAHVLAAYNAGEHIVRRWNERGQYRSADEFIEDIPYPETKNYVQKVLTSYFQYQKFLLPDS